MYSAVRFTSSRARFMLAGVRCRGRLPTVEVLSILIDSNCVDFNQIVRVCQARNKTKGHCGRLCILWPSFLECLEPVSEGSSFLEPHVLLYNVGKRNVLRIENHFDILNRLPRLTADIAGRNYFSGFIYRILSADEDQSRSCCHLYGLGKCWIDIQFGRIYVFYRRFHWLFSLCGK